MSEISANLPMLLVWLLAALFIIAGSINLRGHGGVREDFVRFGYPAGFHLICGALEIAGAALVLWPAGRLYGFILLGTIMAAALATLLRHREPFRHFVPALGFSLVLAAAAALSR